MDKQKNRHGDKQRMLHGNQAKIDPQKHVESVFNSNNAVTEGRARNKDQREFMVEEAREFVEENKK